MRFTTARSDARSAGSEVQYGIVRVAVRHALGLVRAAHDRHGCRQVRGDRLKWVRGKCPAVDDRRVAQGDVGLSRSAAEHRDDALDGDLLQLFRARRRDAEPLEQDLGGLDRARRLERGDRGVGQRAHDDGAVEQALRRRHRRQHRGLAAAARLAEYRDVLRAAAEGVDVVADPLERGDQVEHAEIARVRELLSRARQARQKQIAKCVQPVRHRHDDHVVFAGELVAVIEGGVAGPGSESAAVQPHHDRPRRSAPRAGRPDVEPQAVFAHRSLADERVADFRNHRPEWLRRPRAVLDRVDDAGPRHWRRGRQESPLAGG